MGADLTRQELRDLKQEHDDELYFAAEEEVDRDMPELDGEARYREVMRRLHADLPDAD